MTFSAEDKKFIDNFIKEMKNAAIVGGEVSMASLAKYVSALAPSSISNLSRMFKGYAYSGAFFAIKDSFDQGSADPFYKYALGTIGFLAAVGTGCINLPVFVIGVGIGVLVEKSWALGEWIAENQDDILAKIKEVLFDEGIETDDDFTQCRIPLDKLIGYCPIPQESISQIRRLFDEAEKCEC